MDRASRRARVRLLALATVMVASAGCTTGRVGGSGPVAQPTIEATGFPILVEGGLRFRDLDRSGSLTPYEDWRLPAEARAADLAGRMTDAELAGTIMHGTLSATDSAIGASRLGYDLAAARRDITERHVTSFITRLTVTPARMAEENNKVQLLGREGRLGIPITISTDPRNHFQSVLGASGQSNGYSQWPETLGFAALRDPAITRRFGDVVRSEYRASGIHMALSPQADLFTEPRWSRGSGTFGADPANARAQVQAYVEGFQGSTGGLTPAGVATVVKHWVGYGAAPNGFDGHNRYGRFSKLDERALALHIEPFLGAFGAGVAGVMPTYNILVGPSVDGKPLEPVAAGFNRQLLGLLRTKYRYGGMVLSDWGITRDCNAQCTAPTRPQGPSEVAMPWGVEALTPVERYAKALNAGIDQFGGVVEPDRVLEALSRGMITRERLREAAARVLAVKFRLGLFEAAVVDPSGTRSINDGRIAAEARRTQAAAQVMVKRDPRLAPLKAGTRVWLSGVGADEARAAGLVPVERLADAAVAIVRTETPHERLHPLHFFGSRQNEGRLDFRPGDPGVDTITAAAAAKVPVIAAIFADRPPVLQAIAPNCAMILLNFGTSDAALLDVLTGREKARGRLPFPLPTSMEAVERQDPALPD